jgi:hypothetical protein
MLFALKALNPATGQTFEDRLEAPSAEVAAQIVRQRGLDILELTPLSDAVPPVVLDYQSSLAEIVPFTLRRKPPAPSPPPPTFAENKFPIINAHIVRNTTHG